MEKNKYRILVYKGVMNAIDINVILKYIPYNFMIKII